MSFFEKLKAGLAKTKAAVMGQINDLFKAFVRIDEDMLEELEELLICSDIGAQTTEYILDELRERIKEKRLTEPEEAKAELKEILLSLVGENEELRLGTRPSVILVIGVNGVGKTTSIGKMSAELKSQGKKVLVAAADTFRAAAIEQLSVWCDRAGVELIKQRKRRSYHRYGWQTAQ